MKVGFTGSRTGMSSTQIDRLRKLVIDTGEFIEEFHHGDCVGADADAHKIFRAASPKTMIVIHPPLNEKFRAFMKGDAMCAPWDYLVRNRLIVDATTCLIAAPSGPETLRSGTWSTVRYARKLNRPVIIL